MSQLTICDLCGAETDDDGPMDDAFFAVSRYGERESEHGDICSDCIPDEVIAVLEYEHHPV